MSQETYFEQYQEIIFESIKKIRKIGFKKINIINDYMNKLTVFLEKQIYGRIQPSNFIFLYILLFGSKNPKLHSIILQTVQKLFSNNYVNPTDNLSSSQQFMKNQYKQFIIMPGQYQGIFNKSVVQIYLETIINIPQQQRTDLINIMIAKNISLLFRLTQSSIPITIIPNICDFLIDSILMNKNQEYDKILKSIFLQILRHSIQSLKQFSDRKSILENQVISDKDRNTSIKTICYRYGNYLVDQVAIKAERQQSQNNLKVYQYNLIPNNIQQNYRPLAISITNQKQIKNGKFGWCIVCRKQANYYCKQLRVPVCSFQCKRINLQQTQQFDKLNAEEVKYISIFSSHLQSFCKVFAKCLSHNDIRRRTIFSEIFIHLSSELRKISLKTITPAVRAGLQDIFKQCCANVITQSQALTGCIISLKKLIPLKIFNAEIQVLLHQLSKKLTHFITSSQVKQQILKFIRDLIKSDTLFEIFMDIDCHPIKRDVVKQIITAISDVYQGVKHPQALTNVPPQDPNIRKFCLQILNQLEKTIRSSNKNLSAEQSKQVQKFKNQKNTLKSAIKRFNQAEKPSKVIKILVKQKFFNADNITKEVSKFLHVNNKRLNHVKVGILIGEPDAVSVAIRDQFINQIRFSGHLVDEGLRILLGFFTIPGQSQVVERIIDCFSKIYNQQNASSTVFNHSDAVFSFSYLLMMLQTNLHNPQVVQKMTIQAFSGLSKNMNGQGKQFPQQFLQTIYNSIQKKQLGFHTKHKQIQIINAYQQNQIKKAQEIYTQSLDEYIHKQFRNLQQYEPYHKNHETFEKFAIKLIIQQLAPDIIIGISTKIHQSEDKDQIIKNIQVLQNIIKFSLESDIQVLVAEAVKNLWQEMMRTNTMKKYILMEKLLIWVRQYNRYLYSQWKSVIYLFSMFHRNKLIKKDQSGKNHIIVISHEKCYLYQNFIDSIIAKSVKFNHSNFINIVDALIQNSKQQINQNHHPFCLEKVGQLLQINNARLVDILPLCWSSLRQHYIELGRNKNQKIALFGYDFLKQLVTKFLKRKELQFYQKQYLKPFQQIFNATITLGVKQYVVGGLSYFANNYHQNINKQGWRIIFNIICSAFDEQQDVNVKQKAHSVIKKIYETKFTMLDLNDNYVDFVQILGNMAHDKQQIYVKSCLDAIKAIIQYFHTMHQIDVQQPMKPQDAEKLDLAYWQTKWLPLLSTIYGICGDFRQQVQNDAIQLLFAILMNYGKLFKYQFWKMIMQGILRPTFEQITYTSQSKPINKKALEQWLHNSFSQLFLSINKLIELYFKNFKLFLPDILKIYQSCILNNPNRILIQISIQALNDLINSVGGQFQQLNWTDFIQFLENIAKKSDPKQLHSIQNWKSSQVNGVDHHSYQNKCQTLRLLLITTQNIQEKFHDKLKDESIKQIQTFTTKIYQLCKVLNRDIKLREQLWKNGFFAEMKSLPGLIKQQHQALKSITIGKYHLAGRSDLLLDNYIEHVLIIFKEFKYSLIVQSPHSIQVENQEKERQNTMYQIIVLEVVVPQLRKIGFEKLIQLGYKKLLFDHLLDICTQKTFCAKCKFCEFCEISAERQKKFTTEMKSIIREIFEITM